MTHLQNKPYGYQLNQNKGRECTITRSRYKLLQKQAEPEVYYSDEEDSKDSHRKAEIDKIISEAQGQIQRPQVKEEPNASQLPKTKKSKPLKKKPMKTKAQPVTPPTISATAPQPVPVQQIPIIEEEHDLPQPVQRPYINHQVSFQTNEQSHLNRIQGIKNMVDKKFAATMTNIENKPHPLRKTENSFHFMSEYRAYFEKETNISYEEYMQNHQKAKQKAITSKISQLIKFEKDSKHQLLKKLEAEKFRFRKKTTSIINSIVQISHSNSQKLDNNIVNAACASNLNQSFSNINKFLAVNHTFINQNLPEAQKEKLPKSTSLINENPPPTGQFDQQKGSNRDKKRKDIKKTAESERTGLDQQSHEYQLMQVNKQLELQTNKIKDRSKILASINLVNKKCAQADFEDRMHFQRNEREREEKERAKMAKKEQLSSLGSSHDPNKNDNFEDFELQRKRMDAMKDNWHYFGSNGHNKHKIKRLEILNRYHYNPFQENEGEDQCELWKKLMGMEIKNLKSDNFSIKNQEFNHNILDELLREVEQNENKEKLKGAHNDIFLLHTNYQPQENDKSKEEEEELQRQQLEKQIIQYKEKPKKNKKSKKKEKESKEAKSSKQGKESKSGYDSNKIQASNNEPEIGDFLTLEPPRKIEYMECTQPEREQYHSHNQPQIKSQYVQPQQANIQSTTQNIMHNNQPSFTYDQLPDLEGFDVIKKDDDDDFLFQNDLHQNYKDIQYYENLANRR